MRFLTWCLVWLLCLAVAFWTLVGLPINALFGSGARAWKIAVGYDQLGNAAGGGSEDETFSSRCWRNRERPYYKFFVSVIDYAFLRLKGEENHCQKAYESEKSARENHAFQS